TEPAAAWRAIFVSHPPGNTGQRRSGADQEVLDLSTAYHQSMKRVFVLGAGFSHAINEHMPTLPELSREVEKRLTADHRGYIPGAGTPVAKDFEAWLNYLVSAPPWLSDADRLRN